jgi:lambda repressor-like predicted transcriptional regulator
MKSTVQNIRDSYTAGYSHRFIKAECGNISLQHSERIIVIALERLSERQEFWPDRYSCSDV